MKQGQVYYQEGTAGHASGNHVHFNIGIGYYQRGSYPLVQNLVGSWEARNEVNPRSILVITKDHILRDNNRLNWGIVDNKTHEVSGSWDPEFTLLLQIAFKTHRDKYISGQTTKQPNIANVLYGRTGSQLVCAMEKWVGMPITGQLTPELFKKMQAKVGTPADGLISPNSTFVKKVRTLIAQGKFNPV